MRNEFEKQVQQKMEELDLVPSAPVWEKIELRIRDKKDRRRYVLWFFLLCVLLGGGITWLSVQSDDLKDVAKSEEQYEHSENKNSNTVTANPKTSLPIQDQPSQEKVNPSIKENQTNIQTEEIRQNSSTKNIEKNNTPQTENNLVVTNTVNEKVNKNSTISKTNNQKVLIVPGIPSKSISSSSKKNKPAKKENNKTVVVPVIEKEFISDTKIPVETTPVNPAPQKNDQPAKKTIDTAEAKKAVVVNADPATDPVNKNDAIVDNSLPSVDTVNKNTTDLVLAKPKSKSSKWKFGLNASVGISGLGEGINFTQTTNEKSLRDAFPQASPVSNYTRVPYSPGYTPPSVVKKNIAYSISAVVKRLIGKKTQISTGVGYDHYSTLLESGRMDSVNVSFGSSSGNYQSYTAGSAFKNYSNKFHFITLPLNIHFQVFKKAPLNLYGGLAVKYMVATNAMEYNHLTYLYSRDINAYNRTQVFSNFGIEYAVLNKKNQLFIGPEITYGISKNYNTGSPQHLYSIGIKADFIFQKN